MKRTTTIRDALDFDDVLLVPAETQVQPKDVQVKARLTKTISLNIPLISAGHAQVTESAMAIAMAQMGGIGIIHDSMPLGKQVEEVRKVKRAGSQVVSNPITISPDSSIAEAVDLMTTYKISGLPVVEGPERKVVGIITHRDVRFFEDYSKSVRDLMTAKVVTARPGIDSALARELMHKHRIEKLVLVDDAGRCVGLLTVKDFQKLAAHPNAARDAQGRLLVAAAIGTGKDALDRAIAMTDAGLDAVVVDMAHAHTKDVLRTVSTIRQQRSSLVQIIAGNVVTADAARSLIDAGADAIKVGIGGTATAASRKLGFGVPQLTAILDVASECSMRDIPVLVDGGICTPSDFAKALAAGADCAILNSMFSGTDEAPGEVMHHNGQAYKAQTTALKSGVMVDPYHLSEEAVDTSVAYRGSVTLAVPQFIKGLKMAMAYSGAADIPSLHETAELVRVR